MHELLLNFFPRVSVPSAVQREDTGSLNEVKGDYLNKDLAQGPVPSLWSLSYAPF